VIVESAVCLPESLDLLQAGSTILAIQSPAITVATKGDIFNFMCDDFKVRSIELKELRSILIAEIYLKVLNSM